MSDVTMRLYDHALRVSGASISARAGALVTFRQGLDAGQFGSDEMRAVFDHCPYLLRILAMRATDALEAEMDIRKMRRDGVDAEIITRALHLNRATIEADSAAVPPSYEEQGVDLVDATRDLMNSIRTACGMPTKTLQ